jgi:hypothetical protein
MYRPFWAILTLPLLVGLASAGELKPVKMDTYHGTTTHHVWATSEFSDANGLSGVVNSRAVRIRCRLRGSRVTAWIVVDTKKSDDKAPNIARIVFDGKGDDFRKAVTATAVMRKSGSNYHVTIKPFSADVLIRGKTIPVQIGGQYNRFGNHRTMQLSVATAVEGKCDFGGKTGRVRIMDATGNLRVTDRCEPSARYGYQRGDIFEVRFKNADGKSTVVKGPLGCPVKVDGAWWTVELSEDANSISAKPFNIPMCKVTLPDWRISGYLVNKERVVPLRSSSDGKEVIEVPAGTYLLRNCNLTRTRTTDDKTRIWVDRISLDDRSGKGPITVKSGKTTDLNVGEPLIASLDVHSMKGGFTGRRVRFNLKLTDCAGRRIRGLHIDSSQPEEPTFKVTTEDGKLIYSNSLEYG